MTETSPMILAHEPKSLLNKDPAAAWQDEERPETSPATPPAEEPELGVGVEAAESWAIAG